MRYVFATFVPMCARTWRSCMNSKEFLHREGNIVFHFNSFDKGWAFFGGIVPWREGKFFGFRSWLGGRSFFDNACTTVQNYSSTLGSWELLIKRIMESEYILLFHRNVYFYRAYPKKFILAKQTPSLFSKRNFVRSKQASILGVLIARITYDTYKKYINILRIYIFKIKILLSFSYTFVYSCGYLLLLVNTVTD